MKHQSGAAPTTTPPPRPSVFQWIGYGLSGAAALAVGVPLVGYFLGVPKTKTYWVPLDPVDKYPLNETRLRNFDNPLRKPWDGITGFTGVFVRRLSGVGDAAKFQVFAINCAHLGFPVTWIPQSGLFMCPYHGGVYSTNGEHGSGAPPSVL